MILPATPIILRALKCYQTALKQAIVDHNRAVAEKQKRPYRPVPEDIKSRILSHEELYQVENELSEVALIILKFPPTPAL